jgi:predicted nucleotide-binding protein
MSKKRKPATTSKRSPSTVKTAAQRANQAVIKSSKNTPLRSVSVGSIELPTECDNDSTQEALPAEPATTSQDDCKETMTHNDSKEVFVFSSATANVRAYQAKFLEMAQANMQLAFEFTQRLAAIRSPVELLSVIGEFASKRIAMFQKYSIEMAELGTKR